MFKSINGGILPQRATKYSCGFDVFANEDVTIGAGETVLVGLGIALDCKQIDSIALENLDCNAVAMMQNYYIELHPRSSIRAKGLGGGVGIIDIDYRDEIKMVIHNPFFANDKMRMLAKKSFNDELTLDDKILSMGVCTQMMLKDSYEIKKGDKIGQLILCRHEGWLLPLEYTKDEERNGGFGSTDKAKHES